MTVTPSPFRAVPPVPLDSSRDRSRSAFIQQYTHCYFLIPMGQLRMMLLGVRLLRVRLLGVRLLRVRLLSV